MTNLQIVQLVDPLPQGDHHLDVLDLSGTEPSKENIIVLIHKRLP